MSMYEKDRITPIPHTSKSAPKTITMAIMVGRVDRMFPGRSVSIVSSRK